MLVAKAPRQFIRLAEEAVDIGERVRLRDEHPDVDAFAPVPAAMPRRRGFERAHVLVQSRARSALQAFLPAWREAIAQRARGRVRWVIDVDPTSF